MSGSLDITPKTTEQNLIVRIGKYEAETINIVLLKLQRGTKHRAASLRQLIYLLTITLWMITQDAEQSVQNLML